jgi:secondary thiamine-phosphate synthase enzyme
LVTTRKLQLNTRGNTDIVDITPDTARILQESGLQTGIATVFVAHSTAAVTVVECESGLLHDLKAMFERILPQNLDYQHDRGYREGNGHAHLRASLLGPSVTVPFALGKLMLGTWQQIVVIDFDNRPRSRVVVVQMMGE